MQAYSFPIKGFTKIDCVAELMKMYQNLNQIIIDWKACN